MASYRGHLMFSTSLGVAYGAAGVNPMGMDTSVALIGAGVTAVSGLLPDLDSDSGKPIRELFGLAAAVVPFVLLRRLEQMSLTPEQVLLAMAGIYVTIRYGCSRVFKRITVHRGMYHSIPAMLIAAGLTYLCFDHPSFEVRGFIAGGAALGFLSHLVLDEFSSVNFSGLVPKVNKYAGSALKFASSSAVATSICYFLLGGVLYLVWLDLEMHLGSSPWTLFFDEPPF